jgi:FHS family glucose/mannose:H+ symporter-like MFS transporter
VSITYPMAELRSDHRTTSFGLLAPVFFYFLTAGIATVMLGPLLPSLIQHWQIQDAQAGELFTASFMGQLLGAWFGTRNLRSSILYGAALSAAGCIAMGWASFSVAPIALFCVGLGLGAGLTAGNVIVGTAPVTSKARVLAMLNVAWSLGAISCPVMVRLAAPHGMRLFFLVTASCLAAACLFANLIPRSPQPTESVEETSPSPSKTPFVNQSLSRVTVLVFACTLFLYIGVENSLGGWLPSYAIRTNPTLRASSIAFSFFIAELVGRLLIAALNARIADATLYRASLALLIVAEAVLCAAIHLTPITMVALAILSGLALAPLYPLIVTFILARTGNHPRLGALFACASLGGAVMPWLTGIFSTQFHGLRVGLVVPAVGSFLLLFLSTALTRNRAPMAKRSSTQSS